MGWYKNQGFGGGWSGRGNLLIHLEREFPYWVMGVFLPVRFEFIYEDANDPWTRSTTREWQANFKRVIDRAWSRRFPLRAVQTEVVSSGPIPVWAGGSSDTRTRTGKADVDFEILDVEDRDGWGTDNVSRGQHVSTIKAYRRGPPGSSRGRAHASSRTRELELYADQIFSRPTSGGRNQIVAVHEVGHLIGLDHPVCPRNERRCYGLPGTAGGESIMGSGNRFRPTEYDMFAVLMRSYRPAYEWSVGRYAHQT